MVDQGRRPSATVVCCRTGRPFAVTVRVQVMTWPPGPEVTWRVSPVAGSSQVVVVSPGDGWNVVRIR